MLSEGKFLRRSAIHLLVILLTRRSLKSRHIQFIALGGTIGTGLFLGIGTAFANAGPVSVLLGYSITGLAVFGMMQSLGEMSTWLPLPGAIPQYCARYADPALGFAVGWNNCELPYQSHARQCSFLFFRVPMRHHSMCRNFRRGCCHQFLGHHRKDQPRRVDCDHHRHHRRLEHLCCVNLWRG